MRHPLHSPARLSIAAIVALLAIAGCGGGSDPEADAPTGQAAGAPPVVAGPGSVRRVELSALERPDVSEVVRLAAELPGLVDADWRRSDGTVGDRALTLGRGELSRARLALPELDRTPTRAVLALRAPTPLRAEVVLGDEAGPLASAEGLVQAGGVDYAALDVPSLAYGTRRPTWIEVELERLALGPDRPLPTEVVGARLVAVPPRSLLPAPGLSLVAGPGTRARPSLVVAPGEPLGALLTPGADERLRLAVAVPVDHRDPAARPTLEALLIAPDGEQRRARFPLAPEDAGRWRTYELALDGLAGRELELRLELVEPDDRALLAHVAHPLLVTRGDRPPTVVLVTSDTHRADHLGSARRGVEVRTPTLDALAARGLRFTDAASSANSTNPSHTALMTGTSPADTGIVDNDTPLGAVAPTLSERFAEAGYLTVAATSAIHLGPDWSGLGQGFDAYASPTVPQRDGAETIADLEALLPDAEGLPLFVWLHLFDAHAPYEPPAPFVAAHWPAGRDPFDRDAEGAEPRLAPEWDPRIADPAYTEALYRAEVDYLDERLGRLFDRAPRLTDGWLAFTSDHGEGLRRDPVPFDHQGLSPATLEVPLLLVGPDLAPGVVIDPVRQTDLAHTLLARSGIGAEGFPGRDLVAAASTPTRFALEANRWSASALSDGWQLSLTLRESPADRSRGPLHTVRLYHVAEDPHLGRDLARTEPDRARALRAELVEWLAAHPPRAWTGDRVEGVAAQLELLGYTEGDGAPERGAVWIDPDCACERCLDWRR